MTSTKSHTECTTLNKRILIDALLETSNRLEHPDVEYNGDTWASAMQGI